MLINSSIISALILNKVEWVDTHAHLNFPAFNKDRDGVIKKCLNNNVWLINIGSNFVTSQRAVEIAKSSPYGIFAAIGLHPINLETGLVKIKIDPKEGNYFEKEFDYQKYRELARFDSVVAIGEIGLDYYWKPKTTKKKKLFKQKQKDLLLKELNLANEVNLPVIFHCRMAHEDLLEILNHKLKTINYKLRGVMHGFVGTLEQLHEYLKMGFYIGFNGIIFKKIEGIDFEENIKNTPLDRILLETDCPYLTPPGFPEERNNPLGVKYIAERIAQIKNISFNKVAKATTENAKALLKL
jgi:TatD DNase family protein